MPHCRAQLRRGIAIDCHVLWVDDDAVSSARTLEADFALAHVAKHPLGVALPGRAVAAATTGLVADYFAGPHVNRGLGA